MSGYPNPCDTCTRDRCPKNCAAWRTQYLYRQKQINVYAKVNGIVPSAPKYQLGVNPCDGCRWEENCDTICMARARYWDERMEWLKWRLGR